MGVAKKNIPFNRLCILSSNIAYMCIINHLKELVGNHVFFYKYNGQLHS